ncbi:MAG: mechanosensitive ion channel domain-containing protein [Thermodesulfobacteriota bacterium]
MRKLLPVIALLCLLSAAGPLWAQEPEPAASAPAGYSMPEGEALDRALSEQARALDAAEKERVDLFSLLSGTDEQARALRLQAAAYNTGLASENATSRDLADIRDGQMTAVGSLDESLDELSRRREAVTRSLAGATRQAELFRHQETEVESEGRKAQDAKKAAAIADTAQRIAAVWQEMDRALEQRIKSLTELRAVYAELGGQALARIRVKKRDELFEKSAQHGSEITDVFSREMGAFFQAASVALSGDAWYRKQPGGKISSPALGTLLVLLFAALELLLRRLRRTLVKVEESPACSLLPWRCLLLRALYTPLPLAGAVIFLYAAKSIPRLVFLFPALPGIFGLFAIALCLRWAFLLSGVLSSPELPATRSFPRLANLLAAACGTAAAASVIFSGLLGPEAGLLALTRYGLAIVLLLWALFFGRAVSLCSDRNRLPAFTRWFALAVPYLCYATALVSVSLDLSGYGLLSGYFLSSMAKMAVAAVFGLLFWAVLREARQDKEAAGPYRWAFLRMAWLLWFFLLLFAGLSSFDASLGVYEAIFRFLGRTVTVGSIRFSLLGALFFVLILLVTRVLTGIFRHIFSERVLAGSGMETGLKESFTTLFTYLLWGVGILFALSALGISTTSIAVAMGGLSLGLGFGLQNIFNNFISGLILLFERPIQVGDNVEVNGTWGVVRKINVRSTLVQTYDNASLIIPNSEFISAQVTNWSFKDPRVRRNLSVGVAYGSDVELVRSTLLEIVAQNPRVMKIPKPDVLFMDFADSALVFRLRFWCHVDSFLAVESDIRFTIDRLFRERGISIPFPQRDVHIIYPKEKKDHEAPD